MAKQSTQKKKTVRKDAYKRLQRIFSRDVVQYNTDDGNVKVIDTARRARNSTLGNNNGLGHSPSASKFLRTTSYGSSAGNVASVDRNSRRNRYMEYERMDGTDPIINSALDIYADEATLEDELGEIVRVKCDNDEIKKALETFYMSVLDLPSNIWGWTRTMCKYGDMYLYKEIAGQAGIINVIPIDPSSVDRIEQVIPDQDDEGNTFARTVTKFVIESDDPLFQYKTANGNKREFDTYEVSHFRMLGDTNFLPYGKSMLEGARVTWQQLTLMEDAMLIHRIVRAPDRRIYKIEVGSAGDNEIENLIQTIRNKTKRVPHVDANTGNYDLRYAVNNLMEDLYIPVRGGKEATEVDTLPGLQYSTIEDIEYLQGKLFAALKTPKAYLGYEEDLSGKATLASEDVRFARTIARVQRAMLPEIKKLGTVHLIMKGYELHDAFNFQIEMNTPSIVFERERIELYRDKLNLVDDALQSGMLSREWIYTHVLDMSEDEMTVEKDNVILDALYKFKVYSAENDGLIPDPEERTAEADTDGGDDSNAVNFGDTGGDKPKSTKSKLDTDFKGGSPLAKD